MKTLTLHQEMKREIWNGWNWYLIMLAIFMVIYSACLFFMSTQHEEYKITQTTCHNETITNGLSAYRDKSFTSQIVFPIAPIEELTINNLINVNGLEDPYCFAMLVNRSRDFLLYSPGYYFAPNTCRNTYEEFHHSALSGEVFASYLINYTIENDSELRVYDGKIKNLGMEKQVVIINLNMVNISFYFNYVNSTNQVCEDVEVNALDFPFECKDRKCGIVIPNKELDKEWLSKNCGNPYTYPEDDARSKFTWYECGDYKVQEIK